MHKSSLDLNLGQPSNSNNNYNIINNNNSNLSISTSYSNDNECIFNCSNTQVLLISNNNNNNNTKTGRQMVAAQETKTAEENRENVQSANTTNSGGESERVIGRKPEEDGESAEQTDILRSTADGFRTRSGILVDESASYENDDATGTERMQLNPSDDVGWDDEYDQDEEDEGDDEEDVDTEDVPEAYGDEDAAEEESRVDVIAQARRSDASFESLPEAKGLVQALVGDENESVKNIPNVGKAKSIAHIPSVSIVDAAVAAPTDEEEEDMGFDEDDERIAIIVERQRGGHQQANDNDKGFLNEEGSGAEANRYKNRFRLDYLEKYRKKLHMEHARSRGGGITDGREGSGNFANDDDDDDDDDSDDNDDGDDDDDGVDADANDDADRQEGDNYFNTKHTKSSNRYFRKNTNDAIKIISTPLGKVGIVYQQTPNEEDGSSKKQDASDKKPTSFTDFDALSPDPESSHRLASSHPKITPVLTPDGKVALLYRGDSENSKYEPIRNLTHKFSNNKNEFTDNKASDTINKDTPDFQSNDGSENESADASDDDDDDYDLDSASNSNEHTNSRKTGGAANPTDETQKAAIQNPATDADAADPASGSGGSFIIRPTDSVLPMINRPLSEVLGIKKNQFKQIRIKDHPTAPPNAAAPGGGGGVDGAFAAGDPRSLAGTSIDRTIDTTTLHFLTKVNLAEYPTSMKTRNFDFDFSRDNTMLDERRRYKEHQLHQQQQQQQQGGAGGATGTNNNYPSGLDVGNNNNNKLNEEVLAKTEVVNLAIIPHFDEELERLQRLRELETRRHYRQRYRQRPSEEDLSGIHCIMQAMMGIAAISTVFGMLGTFFKQRILDQIRLMHW